MQRWFSRIDPFCALFSGVFLIVVSTHPTIGQPAPDQPTPPSPLYKPNPLTPGQDLTDRLSETDIPTGQGSFARDYTVQLQAGDQISIDLSSETFDPIVALITQRGATVAENDDGPDGTPNSLLFTRITKAGIYTVRVRAFGETTGGAFRLKLTRLKPSP